MPLHLLDLYFDRAKGLAEQLSLLHDRLSHLDLIFRSEEGMEGVLRAPTQGCQWPE